MTPRLHTQAEVGLEMLNVKASRGKYLYNPPPNLKEMKFQIEEEVEIRTNITWHLLSTEYVSGTVPKYT